MKLKNKLFFAQIIVVLLMFVMMTLMLSQIVYMTSSQNDRDNTMILNEQIMTQIDQYFEELERFTEVVAEDGELKNLIWECMRNPTEQKKAQIRIYLSGLAVKNKMKSYSVRGIYIELHDSKNEYDYSTVGFSDKIKGYLREKLQAIPENEGAFIDPFLEDGDSTTAWGNTFNMVYGYVLPYQDSQMSGRIVVISAFDQIIYIAEKMSGYSNDYLLMNSENQVFLSGMKETGISINEVLENLEYGNSYMEGYYEEPGAITTVRFSEPAGWKIMCRLTREDILLNNQSLILLDEVLVAVFGLCVVLIMLPIVKKFTAPLSKVSEQMQEIAKGNLQARIQVESNDEIAEVGRSFNLMAEKLQENIDKMLEQEKREQKMRYSLLISQVDPHFIYNTMNMITYLAQKGRNEDVIAVNRAMIEILKDRLRIDLEEVYDTVDQEIKVTEQFLIIQKYRYADTFKTEIQIEKEAKGCYIAKNVIQPLVENALFHGILCNRDEDGEILGGCIQIQVKKDGDYIWISIKDNGIGMSEKMIEELEKQPISKIRGKHIGIRNIKGRIHYIYGNNCSFAIRSKEGEGTEVLVKLPDMG